MFRGHDAHIPVVHALETVVATGFLDRLASQLKIGRGRRLPPSSSADTGHRQKELRIRRIELVPVDCSIAVNLFENLATPRMNTSARQKSWRTLLGSTDSLKKKRDMPKACAKSAALLV